MDFLGTALAMGAVFGKAKLENIRRKAEKMSDSQLERVLDSDSLSSVEREIYQEEADERGL